MFARIVTIAAAAALSLAALSAPVGQDLPGEIAATYEDGPWSYLPESMAHGETAPATDPIDDVPMNADPLYADPMEGDPMAPEPSLIASLMARITG